MEFLKPLAACSLCEESVFMVICGTAGKALPGKSYRGSICHEEIEEIRDAVKRAGC